MSGIDKTDRHRHKRQAANMPIREESSVMDNQAKLIQILLKLV